MAYIRCIGKPVNFKILLWVSSLLVYAIQEAVVFFFSKKIKQ